jgi:hypothetical protein
MLNILCSVQSRDQVTSSIYLRMREGALKSVRINVGSSCGGSTSVSMFIINLTASVV